VLVDELGIEPGRELRDLHQAVLRQDPTLDAPAAGPSPTPAEEPAPSREPAQEAPGAPPPETRKTVTAAHVSLALQATTPDNGIDPETVQATIARALDAVAEAVERHGGSLEVITADSATAVFGVPTVHEDDALRAARAAEHVRTAVADLPGLECRIGIATGQALTGSRLAAQVRTIGEPLAAAPRLANAARPGDIALDEVTRQLLGAQAEIEDAGENAAAARLVRLSAPAGRIVRTASPMVGRTRELRRLEDALEQALADRTCQLFTLLGPAGVGKSRLVREFTRRLGADTVVAPGRCLPYGEGITFWPLLEAVRAAAAVEEGDGPEQALAKLASLVAGDEGDDAARGVAELVGMLPGPASIEHGARAACELFEAVARTRPLVLLFDDIHWAEPTFLELVEHLADRVRDAALLVLCVARPELLDVHPGWGGGKVNATTVMLEPLSTGETVELVDNLADAGLDDPTRRRVADAAEGNPLFVEEMLALVREEGGGESLRVPATIQALLAARLDRLPAAARIVAQRASVEGKVFHEGAAAALTDRTDELASSLDALLRRDVVRRDQPLFPGERAYRFRHLLIRDAAYEAIPKQSRAELHARYAEWLEDKAGPRLVEYEEIVGYHLEQAFRYRGELHSGDEESRALGRRAAGRLGSAGHRAFARSDAPAAVNLFSRAVAMLEPGDPQRLDLIPSSRVVQGMGDHVGWAEAVLADALAAGDPRLRAHALVQRGFLRLFTAPEVQPEEVFEVAHPAIETFVEVGDELGLARAWRLVAQTHYLARQGGDCAKASRQALVHARRAGDRFEQREIVEWLGIALWLGPSPARDAEATVHTLLGEVGDDPFSEVHLLGTLGYLTAIQGRVEEALDLMARGKEAMLRIGDRLWLFPVYFALVASWRRDPAWAESELRELYLQFRRAGEQSHFCSVATVLAQTVYAQGRYAEAGELADEAARTARPNDVHSQIVSRATRGKVLARLGDTAAGERLASEAVAFAATSDFLDSHAGALLDLAEILSLSSRWAEAVPHIDEAVRLYELKGNVLAAAHARSLAERA
jgi:class 3 adenylate cyclase/tetratricopeptide (TPR) repeat protein